MIEGLFNYNIEHGQKISISQNEIYNQFLLYMFFSLNKNIVIVTPTLNDANGLYKDLEVYLKDKVYIFPDDDYLTKKAIATSPELMYMRMKFLNEINNTDKKILICHTNSFLKKLPKKENLKEKIINIKINKSIKREELVNKLNEIGYKRESLVTNTGEFSVRGFVVDVFPFFEDHPVRIEFFDDTIDEIKYFDENTQLSIKNLEEINIKPIVDEYKNSSSSVLEYLENPILIYQNLNQIKNVESSIIEQMKYYNDENTLFNIKEINNDFNLYLDTINNNDKYDITINAMQTENYSNNLNKFVIDIINNEGYLCTTDKAFIKKCGLKKEKIIEKDINSGFIYKEITYFSKNDLNKRESKLKYETGFKLGKKIDSIDKLEIGDYVVHKTNGIGIYKGITTISKNNVDKDYILIEYKGNDKLYLSVDSVDSLYKYSSKDGVAPKINKLNSLEWQKTKMKIKKKIHDISSELIKIYKNRSISNVEPFEKDTPEQAIFENEFPYEETADQLKTTLEIKHDLESTKPMDRLLCGDVGYGKTEVIFRAMFKTIMNNRQVAYLCPTTLLSYQQFTSGIERFKNFGVNIALLNRYSTPKETKETLEGLEKGTIDIVFGTHRLLSNDIKFKNLGLLVIDEEQRFGVMHKEKIKELKSNVHVLSVSATPIPRSLQMSLIGIRDLSLIETAPRNKLPVQTYVINYDPYLLREIILKEKARNGQVFILYNKVIDMLSTVENFKKLVPEISIGYAHGKMKKEEMQEVIYEFDQGNYDCLICTTIIENGIDIPNANTIIVMDADRFGLAQLYQIRGRVGRGDRQAYAYLMYDKSKILGETAIKRLDAIKEFTELGSGYKIAMRDLSIRGAGDLLGSEQAGFIDSVGVDMYIELINEELNGIKEEDETTTKIDDVATHISEKYSDEDAIIIELHKKISKITSIEELNKVYSEIEDRFGTVDEQIKVYMYQELTEKLINKHDMKILINDKNKFVLKIEEKIYSKLNIENLFIESTKISTRFNFAYRSNAILITLNKINIDTHYIYYIFELVKYIDSKLQDKE